MVKISNPTVLFQLLNATLPGDTVVQFARTHFPALARKVAATIPRLWKLQLLIDYCHQQKQTEQLLTLLAETDPHQYQQFSPHLTGSPVVRPARSVIRQVEMIFDIDLGEFSVELQLVAMGALAACLNIVRHQISVLKVQPGSVRLQVELPDHAASQLFQLYQAQSPLIADMGIVQVITLPDSDDGAGPRQQIRRMQKNTDRLFAPMSDRQHNPQQSNEKFAQQIHRGKTMIYTNHVRLKRFTTPADETQEAGESGNSPEIPLEPLPDKLRQLLDAPRTIEATGIPESFITSLALKILYFGGSMKGWQMAQSMRLNFSGVVEPVLQTLRRHHLVQVTGSASLNRASYQYAITDKGSARARELLERNRYIGPCPVTLDHYIDVVKFNARNRPSVREFDVQAVLQGLVLSQEVVDRIGPAVNSSRSMFLYGPPGNGKTSIAKAIGRGLLADSIMIPYAIYESGNVITVFDRETHRPMLSEEAQLVQADRLDKRWIRCHAPVVVTGGELSLTDLDLAWSDTNRYYEAPFQLKANGGMLLIDDFGRQQVEPKALLNRWIVPLEERLDFLTFHTGKKFAVPFETLLVFSTNLDPDTLVDDAFLRRIRHKLGIDNPDEQRFYQIFLSECKARGIEFNKYAFIHLLREYYQQAGRSLRACHPRDLLDQVADFARYRDETPEMSVDLLDRAARSYFAELF